MQGKCSRCTGAAPSPDLVKKRIDSGIFQFFLVGGPGDGLAESVVVSLKGCLQGGVVLLGVEEAGGGIGVDELDVVLTDGRHAKQAPAGEVLQLEDMSLGVEVYGVNPAEADSHSAFAEKCGYEFPLLVDRGGSVSRQFRCSLPTPLGTKVIRSVYLINPDRKIRLANRGAPSVEAIIRSIEALQQVTKGGM